MACTTRGFFVAKAMVKEHAEPRIITPLSGSNFRLRTMVSRACAVATPIAPTSAKYGATPNARMT